MGTAKTKSGRKAAIQEYERALADGAAEETAYEMACATYQQVHPRVSVDLVRRIVSVIVGRTASFVSPESTRRTRRRDE
jgi:hypothetical protein